MEKKPPTKDHALFMSQQIRACCLVEFGTWFTALGLARIVDDGRVHIDAEANCPLFICDPAPPMPGRAVTFTVQLPDPNHVASSLSMHTIHNPSSSTPFTFAFSRGSCYLAHAFIFRISCFLRSLHYYYMQPLAICLGFNLLRMLARVFVLCIAFAPLAFTFTGAVCRPVGASPAVVGAV